MIAATHGTTVRLRGVTHTIRPGMRVPEPVVVFWKQTGQIKSLLDAGQITDTEKSTRVDRQNASQEASEKAEK
jgi:dTDP-glucose pyrophosphorylase